MSLRMCMPSKYTRLAAAYARSTASLSVSAVAAAPSTRPPAVTRPPSGPIAVPEWNTYAPSGIAPSSMVLPVAHFSGYPPDAITTQQHAPGRNRTSISESRSPSTARMISSRSVSSSGSTACASGSPKRQLYSMTFGPSTVSISPKYRQPLKRRPSAFIARTVGRKISRMQRSAIAGV
ncbi:MAG: hypothetical protein BWY81_00713 [Firmicutes bacterium ADurb.Bin467]|nr:MAG: hypothetical protein BWY81_00713 [Firmicutes bacterium ADurb.Bin467]